MDTNESEKSKILFQNYENLDKPLHPLQNPFFRDYYLVYINTKYDPVQLHTNPNYLAHEYHNYTTYLISLIIDHECLKPNFPPNINVEKYVPRIDKRKNITYRTGNSFIIYRKYFSEYLESLEIRLHQLLITKLSSDYWKNEPLTVKAYYKDISDQINKIYNQQTMDLMKLSPVSDS
ncbi:hypothetical protein C1645_878879 [Glomus cerebriforme]|uniref:HMG box domain-containing protein n=1 Tax=Glomus cerebriforme TaxID=658196 RepID=A0A397SIT5_9GLOM|nr:hypothetical protein C1645_878879 [Glomus cerebriforme]